jgi:hypothetical protein
MERFNLPSEVDKRELKFTKLKLENVDKEDERLIENIYKIMLSIKFPMEMDDVQINKEKDNAYVISLFFPLRNSDGIEFNLSELNRIFTFNPYLIANVSVFSTPEAVVLKTKLWKSNSEIKICTENITIIRTIEERIKPVVDKKRRLE